MIEYRKFLPHKEEVGAAAAALVLMLGARASAGNDIVGYYHRDEHGKLVFEELDTSRHSMLFGYHSRSNPSTAIVQGLYFCDFYPSSIQDRYVVVGDSVYTAQFTFNRTMVLPPEVEHLDTALTNPPIPNTLLIYFRPDTISTGARDYFIELYPRNRIVYIPELADTNELLQAVDDSVDGWIKTPTCGLTGVQTPHFERKSWGEVKTMFRNETPFVERRFTTGKRGRKWR